MPSQPVDTGWDFSSVIDLIDSDVHDVSSPMLRPSPAPSLTSTMQDNGGVRLGNFAKLYEGLDFLSPPQAQPLIDPESDFSNSDDALLSSPDYQDIQTSGNYPSDLKNILPSTVDEKEFDVMLMPIADQDVQESANEVDSENKSLDFTGMSKKQRKKARRRAEKERLEISIPAMSDSIEDGKVVSKVVNESLNVSINDVDALRAPPQKPRAQSSDNIHREACPLSPALTTRETRLTPTILKEEPKTPKTPKPARPNLSKRSSTTHRGAHRRSKSTNNATVAHIPVVISSIEVPQLISPGLQYPTHGLSTPFQYPLAPHPIAQLQPSQTCVTSGYNGLIPRAVQAQIPPNSSPHMVAGLPLGIPTPLAPPAPIQLPNITQPTIRSQVDRHLHLFNKLLHRFPEDQRWLVAPRQLVNENTTSCGLHVFVDTSNIMYGFRDALRNFGLSQYDMSFDSLALLMERRRPVAKRVSAGSHREANPVPQVTKIFETSKAVGYESNVVEQVLIVREDSEKKKFFNDVKKLGWYKAQQLRSDGSSDSETGLAAVPKTPPAPKWVEQGVDELLHLKMCQSIIDTEVPSTMVLATGDGAEAEMSDGFLAHVERALKKNWKVELISWKQQINGGYRNRKFRTKWAEQFTIIELDDFLEDIIDTP